MSHRIEITDRNAPNIEQVLTPEALEFVARTGFERVGLLIRNLHGRGLFERAGDAVAFGSS